VIYAYIIDGGGGAPDSRAQRIDVDFKYPGLDGLSVSDDPVESTSNRIDYNNIMNV
jgi:hypothetical protein